MQTNRSNYSDDELNRRAQFDRSRPLERDETDSLISSDKVEGTKVYSTDGEHLGTIDHVMLGKRSGRIEYTVMSFGGFLGMGESYFPVPWDALDYDTDRGGYVVNIDKSRLSDAPSYGRDKTPSYDEQYGRQVYGYYGLMY
ncbi:MAG: PRC-barrel domain-containing protein [Erythrobacter sp.]|nr:MAG: PRC-barrel domain-containing protein [Erythrobacter sp.]